MLFRSVLPKLELLKEDGSNATSFAPQDGSPAASVVASASKPQMRPDMPEQQELSFLDQLSGRMQNPMFQGGLGLFLAASQGGNLNEGLSSGIDRSNTMQQTMLRNIELRRKQAAEAGIDKLLANPSALPGVNPVLLNIAKATGDVGPIANMIIKHPELEAEKAHRAAQAAFWASHGRLYDAQSSAIDNQVRMLQQQSTQPPVDPTAGFGLDETDKLVRVQAPGNGAGDGQREPTMPPIYQSLRAESKVLGKEQLASGASERAHADYGPYGTVTTNVPGLVTTPRGTASKFGTEIGRAHV